jgi:glycosyltransferase involved in cell wall biosynthesis
MDNIRNILIVTPGYPKRKGDLTNPFVYNVARLLKNNNIKVSVVTMHFPNTKIYEIIDGIEIYRVRYAPDKYEKLGSESGLIDDIRRSLFNKVLLFPMLFTFILKTLKLSKKYDILLVQWVPTAIIALPSKWLFNKPIIINSHTYPDTKFWKTVYKILIKFSDGIIFNSSDNMKYTSLLCKHNNMIVIPPGIDLEQYKRPQNHVIKKKNNNLVKLIVVARLIEFKGVEYAIRAVEILKKNNFNVMLTIIGDGVLREELEQLTKKLKITDCVTFTGLISHDKVQNYLWESDIFLIPSIVDSYGRTEGFGTVILEAMAAGLPVIASKVGGIVDIINGKNGIFVEQKNEYEIFKAVKLLIENREKRESLIEEGYKFVMKNYSDNAIWNKYKDFFFKVLSEGKYDKK